MRPDPVAPGLLSVAEAVTVMGAPWGLEAGSPLIAGTIVPRGLNDWLVAPVVPTTSVADRPIVYGPAPGGVNVMLADGSVRFVKDSVSPQTWMALGTKSNGEVLTSDSY